MEPLGLPLVQNLVAGFRAEARRSEAFSRLARAAEESGEYLREPQGVAYQLGSPDAASHGVKAAAAAVIVMIGARHPVI